MVGCRRRGGQGGRGDPGGDIVDAWNRDNDDDNADHYYDGAGNGPASIRALKTRSLTIYAELTFPHLPRKARCESGFGVSVEAQCGRSAVIVRCGWEDGSNRVTGLVGLSAEHFSAAEGE